MSFIVLASFLLTVLPVSLGMDNEELYLPLMSFGINKVYWLDKLLFGSIIGGLLSFFGYIIHNKIKKVNGEVLLPYQGVLITLILLFVTSAMFYFIL